MYLVTNSVQPQQVEETDSAYLIRDVPFLRPMRLSGGYVPEDSIKQTSAGWNNRPATLNHVRNDEGKPIAANRKPEQHLGKIVNPYYDGEHVRGDIRVNKSDLSGLSEAEKIEAALENGEQIEVSSQYAAEELPPGDYDGEYRENAERIIRPDSVAILPTQKGQCSIEDGCGINPELAANSEFSLPIADDGQERPEDMGSGVESPVEGFDPEEVDPEQVREMSDNSALEWVRSIWKATTGAESPTDADADSQTMSLENEDEIEFIAANSDYDRENLEAWDGTDCLMNLHETVQANVDEQEEETTEETEDVTDNTEETADSVVFESRDEFESTVEEIVANRVEQSEKEELVDEIVANSAEYDEDDRETLAGTPKPVLEDIRSNVESSGSGVPASGSAKVTSNDDIAEDVTAGVFD